MNKNDIRKEIRDRKKQYTAVQLRDFSARVLGILKQRKVVKDAKTVCLYYSLPDEVYTHDLVDEFVNAGKVVLLPCVISEDEMELRRYTGRQDLEESAYHILEPSGDLFRQYDDIDVVIVPGMGFDREGNRLGRGKGYYDRFLSLIPDAYKIGICFDFQLRDKIPVETTDIPMDEVISNIVL